MTYWLKFKTIKTPWMRINALVTLNLPDNLMYLDFEFNNNLMKYCVVFASQENARKKMRRSFILIDNEKPLGDSYKQLSSLQDNEGNKAYILYEKIG